jgi:DNA (cytosine-5)-methyltransferase 1
VKPRLLDLFCGAGGAAMGYARAGFEVVGVDITPQPNYCGDEFVEADALRVLDMLTGVYDEPLINALMTRPFDAVHASPPCQAYIRSGMVAKDGRHPDLLGRTRELLEQTGFPWVIENVPGAPMRADLVLCGSMFGLGVRRHRWFESNVALPPWPPAACDHSLPITGVYGHPHGKGGAWRNGRRPMLPSDRATWSREMGIDWMHPLELAAAIPPAYTEFLGGRLLNVIEVAA